VKVNTPLPYSSRMSFKTNEDMARQWRHILRRQNQNQGRDQGDHEPSSSTWNLDRESVTVAQKPRRESIRLPFDQIKKSKPRHVLPISHYATPLLSFAFLVYLLIPRHLPHFLPTKYRQLSETIFTALSRPRFASVNRDRSTLYRTNCYLYYSTFIYNPHQSYVSSTAQ
jgi:hypothetical protein